MSRAVRRPRASASVLAASLFVVSLALCACAQVAPPVVPPALAPQAAAPPPQTRVVQVRVPTPVKCVPDDLGPAPAYPDTDRALRDAGGAADRYQLLAAGRLLRDARLRRLEEVVRHCRTAAR